MRIANSTGDADWGQGLFASHFTGGDIRSFLAWYRDPVVGPCGSGFNLSNGATIVFLP